MIRYMKNMDFAAIETRCGLKMKAPHTIIDKWPTRLKLQPDQQGAQDEFNVVFSSSHRGMDRYVEWARIT